MLLPLRFVLVLSAIGLAVALLGAGCATTETAAPAAASPEVEITVRPWQKPVRLVSKAPSRERYVFVGNVRVVARDGEFVEAARAADEKLREKARQLGADVVQIDVVSPNESAHLITLAGRAYRSVY